ncbi:hypothetical protein CXG81DRAFT_11096 [Caulochytrium protostelioides]|uniref:Rhomboid-domain-containing protein n=1 Tax=Caulochytrium protostelioides TaxID=1555241 RepID=A0A4P9XAL9_9FUNG|nr:rhomboid-domain-containing protein [Caulochytrium protostelioides]RKP02180.1 hypothetical protein CXG81DRAFT_11096 [Caulochytrium protostelioides]|eukprot:RKP02180.1 hypothetical protein CXG81DRAFT_11096 [Caulochytrium protostelioides]
MAESRQHRPYFTMVVTALQVATLIAGFILNWKWTGSVIETNPFNYLIGPSSGVLIAMGARFLPCIRGHSVFETSLVACTEGLMPVANPSFVGSVQVCSLADYCAPYSGGGNQWYRFFMAMFLHGGVLHFIMNMAFQLRSGWALEREYGWWRYGAIYLTSGIGGFIFGGLFAGDMSVSVGCSGALYGLNACLVLDLIQNWGLIRRPKLELFKMTLSVIFSFVLGTLPYIDNMAHLGGFFTGIFSSLIFAPTMHFSKWDRRRKRFMTVISMPILVVIMFFMFYDFYRNTNRCPWCKYINCIPGMPWCDQKW